MHFYFDSFCVSTLPFKTDIKPDNIGFDIVSARGGREFDKAMDIRLAPNILLLPSHNNLRVTM